jgi:hypothetical protein
MTLTRFRRLLHDAGIDSGVAGGADHATMLGDCLEGLVLTLKYENANVVDGKVDGDVKASSKIKFKFPLCR